MNDIWYVDAQTDDSSVAFQYVCTNEWIRWKNDAEKNTNGNKTCHFMANLMHGATGLFCFCHGACQQQQ